jgi:hypothetical protein
MAKAYSAWMLMPSMHSPNTVCCKQRCCTELAYHAKCACTRALPSSTGQVCPHVVVYSVHKHTAPKAGVRNQQAAASTAARGLTVASRMGANL